MADRGVTRQRFDFRSLTALIVDGNEFSWKLTQHIFERLKFGRILVADNVLTANSHLQQNDIDFIITEWSAPRISGRSLLHYIRSGLAGRNQQVSVVVMSAIADLEMVIAARDAGGTDFVARPIALENLLDRVTRTLAQPRPFVKSNSYTGPDRRRRALPFAPGERRAAAKPAITDLSARALSLRILRPDGMSQEDLVAAAREAVADEHAQYLESRRIDLDILVDTVRDLKERRQNIEDLLIQIYTKSKDLAGLGQVFGYPLLSKAADLMCRMLWRLPDKTICVPFIMQAIETHVTVISLIIKQDIKGDGGELGPDLIDGLQELVDVAARTLG